MVFSSFEFILVFMPIFFAGYYIAPNHFKNTVLLMGSLCFYLAGTLSHPEHFLLLGISIVLDFIIAVSHRLYLRRKI